MIPAATAGDSDNGGSLTLTRGATMRGWLRLVLLRPFAPGLAGAKTWEILVTVQ